MHQAGRLQHQAYCRRCQLGEMRLGWVSTVRFAGRLLRRDTDLPKHKDLYKHKKPALYPVSNEHVWSQAGEITHPLPMVMKSVVDEACAGQACVHRIGTLAWLQPSGTVRRKTSRAWSLAPTTGRRVALPWPTSLLHLPRAVPSASLAQSVGNTQREVFLTRPRRAS